MAISTRALTLIQDRLTARSAFLNEFKTLREGGSSLTGCLESRKKDLQDELVIYCEEYEKYIKGEGNSPLDEEALAWNLLKTDVETELYLICQLIE